jgi:hypothetical protein
MKRKLPMKVIQPNCRIQFTAQDLEFITATLSKKKHDPQLLTALLADEEARDLILDDETLFQALIEQPCCLRVSTHFYFYVLVRRVLRQSGVEDRAVADYVAEVLAEFSRMDRTRCAIPDSEEPLIYFVDMLAALRTADDRTSFYIRAHIGNQSLFMSGVFPEHIRFRAEYRGSPDLKYYEELGQSNYRAASDHRLAERYELGPVLATLAEQFQTTRLALNDLAQRLFMLNDPELPSASSFEA